MAVCCKLCFLITGFSRFEFMNCLNCCLSCHNNQFSLVLSTELIFVTASSLDSAFVCMLLHTHTHPFNGPLSGTTRVSRYQKGKTNLDFTEARDSEWQWHPLGHMQVCTSPHSSQITTPAPHHSVFYRPNALPAAQPTASKH